MAVGYDHAAKLRLRTGGSTGKIPRNQAHKLDEGDGYYYDLTAEDGKHNVRLPVKYRFRSPIVFELHIANKRKADAYAVIWLHHFIDNEDQDINIPIWQTAHPARLTQNYITEDNCDKEPGLEDIKQVGRLQFRARFKAGTDESHEQFIVDNDSRETYETWEACLAEGVRDRKVDKELSDRVQQLHDQSLTEGRDILKSSEDDEKKKWLSRTGEDWSGAFGEDPKAYMDTKGKKRREPGVEEPLHDRFHPSDDEAHDDDDDDNSDSSSDLGIQDADNTSNAENLNGGIKHQPTDLSPNSPRASQSTARTDTTAETYGTLSGDSTKSNKGVEKQNKRTEERKQRGLMQWKPARNARFAKNQSKLVSTFE